MDSKLFFFNFFIKNQKEFKGIELAFDFMEKFILFLEKNKYEKTETYVCLYDCKKGSMIKYHISENDFNDIFHNFYYEYLLKEILIKNTFNKRLIFLLRKKKVFSFLKRKKYKLILLVKIVESFIKSQEYNSNSFAKNVFLLNLNQGINSLINFDSQKSFSLTIYNILLKNNLIFSLKEEKFSISDNSFYMLLNCSEKKLFIKIKNYSSVESSKIELLNFFLIEKQLKYFLKNRDINNLVSLTSIFNKNKISSIIDNIINYYFDFKQGDLEKFSDYLLNNKLLLIYFNAIFVEKYTINFFLFKTLIFSCFNNYDDLK